MTLDINAFEKALTAALAGITNSTGVYNRLAPPNAPYPFVTFHQQSDMTDYVYTGRAWDDLVYQVKAIDRGDSTKRVNDMAAAIEAALTDATFSLTAGSLLYLRKISGFAYPEMSEAERFNHAGGLYRVWLGT